MRKLENMWDRINEFKESPSSFKQIYNKTLRNVEYFQNEYDTSNSNIQDIVKPFLDIEISKLQVLVDINKQLNIL